MNLASTLASTSTAEDEVKLESVGDVWELLKASILDLVEGFIGDLPLFLIAGVVFAIGLVAVRFAVRTAGQAMAKGSVDDTLQKLTLTFLRLGLLLVLTMVALSVAGIEVGAALAGLGLLGLALAFAFQNILENFIAGILILIRKPFRIGDQIIASEYEGTVVDVNMRITKLHGYDGVSLLLPNADVFRNPLVNLTELGRRRSSVAIGVDYRDDHDAVAGIVGSAVAAVEGVLPEPLPEVLCTGLGDSSVDFEIRYWTLPDIRSVRHTQDRVLRAAKSAVEGAGMSIPWPIRTLEPGAPLVLRTQDAGQPTDEIA